MNTLETPKVQPVILGGDIGAYSLARAFFEGYGVNSVVLSGVSTGIMRHSGFIIHVTLRHFDDDEIVLDELERLAELNPDSGLIAVASADWLVQLLVRNRRRLEKAGYTVPYVDQVVFNKLTSKAGFYEACERLGVPYPKTVTVTIGEQTEDAGVANKEPQTGRNKSKGSVKGKKHNLAKVAKNKGFTFPNLTGFTYPLIAKASSTSAYHEIEFEGKKKVHKVDSKAELRELLTQVQVAGYRGDFIIQDFIPGDDSGMRILTCYCDQDSNVTFSAYGQVLLEEHAPGALGNPAAIITEPNPEAAAQAAKLLKDAGWVGFANFDLKFDPRDGEAKFFELNPRLGRSNYYITGAGTNPVKFYVEEWLEGNSADAKSVLGADAPVDNHGNLTAEQLYTVVPGTLLRRYLFNSELKKRATQLLRSRRCSHPLRFRVESHPRRRAFIALSQLNQWRKFRRYYPVATAKAEYKMAQSH
jgi:D-aspartate ligase